MKKPNITFESNVYVLNGDFRDDKTFQSKIHGCHSVKEMAKHLAGLAWAGVGASYAQARPHLTHDQRRDFGRVSYCSLLGDPEEQVWGRVMRNGRQVTVCRCYKTECDRFLECYESNPADDYVQVITPEQHKAKMVDAGKTRGEVASPGRVVPIIPIEPQETALPIIDVITIGKDPTVPPLIFDDSSPQNMKGGGQETVIKANISAQLLVVAPPGTGKTHSLLERLEYLVEKERCTEPDRILLLCFTRAAVNEIRERLDRKIADGNYSDALSRVDVRTFDSFATQVLIYRGIDCTGQGYDERIKLAVGEIRSEPAILENMQHFFVDEIQDLVGVRARLVQAILQYRPENCGFTLLGDNLQGIYDYQVRECEDPFSAQELFDWIKQTFEHDLQIVELTGNRRQTPEMARFTEAARGMIRDCDPEKCKKFIIDKIGGIKPFHKLHNFHFADGETKTAILCRSNGEALKASTYLRKRQIKHNLRIRNQPSLLPAWMADVLMDSDRFVNFSRFSEILRSSRIIGSDLKFERVFSLLDKDFGKGSKGIEIEEVKKRILQGQSLADELYAEPGNIVVSTIHQSKGREFDHVLITAPWDLRDDTDPFEEAKVFYVAATRPKASILILDRFNRWTWIDSKKFPERCLELGGSSSKPIIKGLQIGLAGDVDEQSFVDESILEDVDSSQEYIRQCVMPGNPLVVKKTESLDGYGIYHNGKLIGKMSDSFFQSVSLAMRSVYRRGSYPPDNMVEVYVDRKYAVVKNSATIRKGVPTKYLKTGIWVGIHVVGMGQIRADMESGGVGE